MSLPMLSLPFQREGKLEMACEYYDSSRCARCGGRCCAIYRPTDEGGGFPSWEWWFPEWVAAWQREFKKSGALALEIKPIYDPSEFYFRHDPVQQKDVAQEILARGGHPDYCQYWRRDGGCTLPWEFRPRVCREYRCKKWKQEVSA